MTDADVAEFFGISKTTLQRRLRHPVAGEINLAKAEPGIIGGRRFWLRSNVEEIITHTKGSKK